MKSSDKRERERERERERKGEKETDESLHLKHFVYRRSLIVEMLDET